MADTPDPASASRWQRLEALFEHGVALPVERRESWLSTLDEPPELLAELRALLRADADDDRLEDRIGSALLASAAVPAIGNRLGAWQLVGELGSGGVGVVFLAERIDGGFRQQAAIKLIRGVAGSDAARQLRHERQILAELDHPSIARLLEGGETDDGQPYLVIEHVRGEPITAAVRARGLPVAERVALVRDLARAVHYAHQRLVIHRDIKPANVLLRPDGRPVLLDFGIAKLLGPAADAAAPTQPWFTPGYAAPEQRSGGAVSTATDIYALGLLLVELLTDQPPELAADGSVLPPSTRAPQRLRAALRGDLDCIVARASAPEPGRRYPSAEALANDLARHLLGRPILAAPDTPGYRAGKLLRRHPLASAATIAAVALLALLGMRVADEHRRALHAERVARDEAQANRAATEFLVNIFQFANPGAAGVALTPTRLVDLGRERLAADTSLSTAQRAQLKTTLGRIYRNLGQPEPATTMLVDALADTRAASMGPEAEAGVLLQLGDVHAFRESLQAAEQAFEEAITLLQAAGRPLAAAQARVELGAALVKRQQLSDAERTLREALGELRRSGASSADIAQAETTLAHALALANRIDEAGRLIEPAIATLRREVPPDDLALLSGLGYYAWYLSRAGDPDGAEQVFLELIAHRERLLETDSGLLNEVHNALGNVYFAAGRTLDALEQFERALEIGQRIFSADDPSLALDYYNLAVVHDQRGDYREAARLSRHALDLVVQRPQEHAFRITQYRQTLGRALMLDGQQDAAFALLSADVADGEGARFANQRHRRRFLLAEWHRRNGEPDIANRLLDEAEAAVDEVGGTTGARHAHALRVRARLSADAGDVERAGQLLRQARSILVDRYSETYVSVGEIDLDLAELAAARGDMQASRRHLADAVRALDPVVAAASPQRQRLRHVAAANGAAIAR